MMRFLAILALIVVTMLTAEAGENVLENSGFESGNRHAWYPWQTVHLSEVVEDSAKAHSGAHCLKLELDPDQDIGGFVQNAYGSLKWGADIHASAWIKTENLGAQHAYLKIEFFDENWVFHGGVESEHVRGTTDWTKVSVRTTLPAREEAPRLDKINVVLCISSRKTGGEVYFDDIYVGTEPEEPVKTSEEETGEAGPAADD